MAGIIAGLNTSK